MDGNKRLFEDVLKGDSPEGQPSDKKLYEQSLSDNSITKPYAMSSEGSILKPAKLIANTQMHEASAQSTDQKLDAVLATLASISAKVNAHDNLNIETQLAEINAKLSGFEHLETQIAGITGELASVQQTIKQKDHEIKLLRDEIMDLKKMKEKTINLEAQSRRDNLIFHGLKAKGKTENDNQCREVVYDFLVCDLKILDARDRIKISRAHRVKGPLKNDNLPMIVKFHYYPDRVEVWEKRFVLKNTMSNIWMAEDFPREIENERDILRPFFKRALKLNMKPKLVRNKLIIKGKAFTIENVHEIPDCVSTDLPDLSKNVSDVIILHEQLNPLLTTHPGNIVYQGATYSSLEQFYQYHKAEVCGDGVAAQKVLGTSNTRYIRKVGSGISENSAWSECKESVMLRGLEIKLSKNDQLKSYLMATGTKTLAVANTGDQYWGTGLNSKDARCMDPKQWPGDNHYGQLLMTIRDKLSAATTEMIYG